MFSTVNFICCNTEQNKNKMIYKNCTDIRDEAAKYRDKRSRILHDEVIKM